MMFYDHYFADLTHSTASCAECLPVPSSGQLESQMWHLGHVMLLHLPCGRLKHAYTGRSF